VPNADGSRAAFSRLRFSRALREVLILPTAILQIAFRAKQIWRVLSERLTYGKYCARPGGECEGKASVQRTIKFFVFFC
jgi:hypothetical protein